VAACGVTVPRLDHVRRVADLVLELQGILQRINLVQGTRLGLRAGIDCGPVRMGTVGTRRMRYDLWGQALSTTRSLCLESPPDTLLVTPRAWERLRDTYELEAAGEAWALRARRVAQESAQGGQP
jgi:class 3 adenylate cyclase